jgi:actin-like ATPase involved in cell morphogenesis
MAVGETASHVCSVKEGVLDLSKSEGVSKIEVALSICYEKLIRYVLESVSNEFAKRVRMPGISEPLPIILGGGTASPNGFLERFQEALRQVALPVKIGPVRMAGDPLNCVATGALVAAQAEEKHKKTVEPSRPPMPQPESSLGVPQEVAQFAHQRTVNAEPTQP